MKKFNFIIILFIISCSNESELYKNSNEISANNQFVTSFNLKRNLTDLTGIYEEIELNIKRIEVHKAGGKWSTYIENIGIHEILAAGGDLSVIFSRKILEPGHYTMIRLIIEEENYITVDSMKHKLDIPSDYQTGLKIPCNFHFEGGFLKLAIDLNVDHSIGKNKKGFFMKPVVHCGVSESYDNISDEEGEEEQNQDSVPTDESGMEEVDQNTDEPIDYSSCIDTTSIPENWCSDGVAIVNFEEGSDECISSLACVVGEEDVNLINPICYEYNISLKESCEGIVLTYNETYDDSCYTTYLCLKDVDGDGFMDFVD